MSADLRARYLTERVMTATPGQRVVMLYDRLSLDLVRAADSYSASDPHSAAAHIDHAMQVVAELAGSLKPAVGGPAENLASLYGYLLRELSAVRSGSVAKLAGAQGIIGSLRDAWSKAVASTATPAAAGAWVG